MSVIGQTDLLAEEKTLAHDPGGIPPPHTFAPSELLRAPNGDVVLEMCTFAGMVGVLHQLGALAAQAHQVFSGLTEEANRSVSRVGALKDRMQQAADRLARVDDALQAANVDELCTICTTAPGMAYTASSEEQTGLFTAASRPAVIQAAWNAARPMPPLGLLDAFVSRPAGPYAKYGLVESCSNGYSDEHFFLKQWLDEEQRKRDALKAERKARRAERREQQHSKGATVKKGRAKRIARKKYMTEEEKLGLVAGGGGLKKASERTLAEPAPADGRNALLAEIQKGRNLKKVVIENTPKQQAAATGMMGGVSVAAILARRAALTGSDDESSDDDDWDD